MKCPICATRLHPGSDRCSNCGYRSRTSRHRSQRDEGSPGVPMRILGCLGGVLAAAAILLLLFVGLHLVFSDRETVGPVREPEASISLPREEEATVPTIPAAQEGCFLVAEHTVTFLPERWDGNPVLRIPESIDGETVTTIGPGCFQGCEGLTTIILPDSITAISPKAFAGCSGLRGLYLPEGTGSIGRDAFAGCISLEAIYVPSSVTHIASGCFDDCASLLYIFYEGSFDSWDALYSDYINPYTTAVCLDGNYYHGADD